MDEQLQPGDDGVLRTPEENFQQALDKLVGEGRVRMTTSQTGETRYSLIDEEDGENR